MSPGGSAADGAFVRYATPTGRWVLGATVLGSAVVGLDATVVNVALRTIGDDLDAGTAGLQAIITGYLVPLAALILLGGALGDRFGRRRVFVVGVIWFVGASVLCAVAPDVTTLVAARALQGVGGALLTPGSLAIIQGSFHPDDRGRAIGLWAAFAGVATAIGPLVGGYLVDAASWRWIFLVNVPVGVAVVGVTVRHVPERRVTGNEGDMDYLGAALASAGLGGVTYALLAGATDLTATVLLVGVCGALALAGFVAAEARRRDPMLPLDIFRSRQFTSANVVTLAMYAGLGGMLFLLATYLQSSLEYSPTESGLALLPVTLLMLTLSARAGALAQRIGPRLPMTIGPLVVGGGLALMSRIQPGTSYLDTVLPAAVVFGLGLALTVAPLTATVLAAVEDRHAGVASGVNNAVARTAQLLAVAVFPLVAGLTGSDYNDPARFADGFPTAAFLAAGLAAGAGLLAWFTIRSDVLVATAPAPGAHHCAMDGTPIRPHPSEACAA